MEQQAINLVANILLVEDDDDLAELVQMHLKFQGHQVSRATNVADAKAQYQQQPFDLLILDRGLPDGDGLDICHYLRQQQ
ncbi:response regulator, partial [Vibrio owensii]